VPDRDLSRDQSQPDTRPGPLSSTECDLRGLPWMPLQTEDLLDSDLWLLSDGWEFKAAMGLICKSWRQVPAGSLPNDDRALATLAGVPDWTSVRTMALRNWVLCSDGRLYHPVVAAKAMEALPHRQQFVEKKTADAHRKERERNDRRDMFAKLKAAGIAAKWDTKTTELRELVRKLEHPPTPTPPAPPPVTKTGHLSRDQSRLGQGHDTTPQGQLLKSPPGSGDTPASPSPPAPRTKTGPVLEGEDQASPTPLKECPDTFTVTEAMVQWATRECPSLTLEDLRKETKAFRNHRFRTGRIKWRGTWENWMLEEDKRRASRMRPAGGAAFTTTREQQIAKHLPGIAAAPGSGPPSRVPPPRSTTITDGDVTDATPRLTSTDQG
jgi:hypothetical protein